jgi:ABC-2 type transport system permease protein
MKAVFWHELSSWRTNLQGYVFACFLLVFAGIFTAVLNLYSMYTNFEYALGNMSFVFIVVVPVVTMHIIAAERRQKTDQLLYSLPLGMPGIVLGKYAAMLVPLLVPTCILSLYPLVLGAFGDVNLRTAYGAILGFFLLGAALLAIGMFLSSLTENQAVAAGLCVVVMLLNYFLADLSSFLPTTAFASLAVFIVLAIALGAVFWAVTKSGMASFLLTLVLVAALVVCYNVWTEKFEGLVSAVVLELSLYEQFYQFLNNVFDLRAVFYLASVAAVFVFLTIQSLEKRRWGE